ncbi:ADP-ribosylation factor-like protein 2-binding protein isoform X3 [Bacillus rossius redtenbacheri]|uniref:ADP-ribosylation factor-like protein 2-binding protein isoform X3 n=1 Tax=Bacillus rossius redtenbacheri TaxID=93214 RepID=UPI002FDE13A6
MSANGEDAGIVECLTALKISDGDGVDMQDSTEEDQLFDSTVGHIEEMLMDVGFQKLQKEFMEKYWCEFEDKEENKLSYMTIFQEYIQSIEKYIENFLMQKIQNFSMDDFVQSLHDRKDKLDGEVFEMMFTFSDFVAFKEMFLDYRAAKEGTIHDLSQDILITSVGNS